MNWISTDAENLENLLKKLQVDSQPLWGKMSSWEMVEHLGDMLGLALNEFPVEQKVADENIKAAQAFILSEKPLPRNFKAPYGTDEFIPQTTSLDEAKKRYINQLNKFRSEYKTPDKTALHPSFGYLNKTLWERLNQKHTHHHFMQFGLVPLEEG